jgi:hypothetical protein
MSTPRTVYGKRSANSPKENMSKKGAGQNYESDPDTLIKIELIEINGKPFFGQVSEDELLYIWVKVFNRPLEELFGVTSTKSLTRNIRAIYKLNAPAKVHDIISSETFAYEKFLDDGSVERISGRILGYANQKRTELGELTKVSVKTNFGVDGPGVLAWLKLYGTPTSHSEFVKNERTGIRSDIFEAEIILKKHIPEYLPMFGQKCQVNYPGIDRMCNRCYRVGHLRRDCNNLKRDWIVYVQSFLDEGFNKDLIGSWKNAIARWKNANTDAADK